MSKRFDPWKDKKTYNLFGKTVYIIPGRKSDPVRWYTELHSKGGGDGSYIASRGSNQPTELLAVIETVLKGDK